MFLGKVFMFHWEIKQSWNCCVEYRDASRFPSRTDFWVMYIQYKLETISERPFRSGSNILWKTYCAAARLPFILGFPARRGILRGRWVTEAVLNKSYNCHCSFLHDIIMEQSARLVSCYELKKESSSETSVHVGYSRGIGGCEWITLSHSRGSRVHTPEAATGRFPH